MKYLRLIIPCLCLFLTFIACKKDDDKPEAPVDLSNTTWIDSANVGGLAIKPFKVVFNADGTAWYSLPAWEKTTGAGIKLLTQISYTFSSVKIPRIPGKLTER